MARAIQFVRKKTNPIMGGWVGLSGGKMREGLGQVRNDVYNVF